MNTLLAMLIVAVAAAEGNPDGGFADGGRSVGPLCVTRDCVRDVNRKFGTRYVWPQDMRDYRKASDVFVKYTAAAGMDFGKRCRIWNRGPTKYNDRLGWAYQKKVMRYLR